MTTGDQVPMQAAAEQRDALVGRLFEAAIATLEVLCIYVGDRLGLYAALAGLGAATSAELAVASGTNERYVREWLEQQAASGILDVDDASVEAAARRYTLPLPYQEVFLTRSSLNFLTPLLRLTVGVVEVLPIEHDFWRFYRLNP